MPSSSAGPPGRLKAAALASLRWGRGIFASREANTIGLVGMVGEAAYYFCVGFVPQISNQTGMSAGWLLFVIVAGNVVATLLGGMLGDAFRRDLLALAGLLVGAAGSLLAAFAVNTWMIVPALVMIQFAGQAPVWLLSLGQHRTNADRRGELTGQANRVSFAGLSMLILILALVIGVSIRWAWAVYAVALVANAFWARRRTAPDTIHRTPIDREVLLAPLNALRQDMRGLALAWGTAAFPLVLVDTMMGVLATGRMGLPPWVVGVSADHPPGSEP